MAKWAINGAPQARSTQVPMQWPAPKHKDRLHIDQVTDPDQEKNYDELRQKEKTRTRPKAAITQVRSDIIYKYIINFIEKAMQRCQTIHWLKRQLVPQT